MCYLSWLHCLVLIDDTVIFVTTRHRLEEKAKILLDHTSTSGMKLIGTKTKFIAMTGTVIGKQG